MRMSSFLFGGLVGAAAVMYFSKNNRPFSFSSFSSATHNMNKMLDDAKNSMTTSSDYSKTSPADSEATREKVRDIINEDPALKQTVDEIANANNTTYQ